MQKVWSRVLLGNPQASLLGTIPGAILGTLVCWSSTAIEAQAGVTLDLSAAPIGIPVTDGVAFFQHTTKDHSKNVFLTTQGDQKKPNDDGFVAAFNGASENTENPEAIFTSGGGKTNTIKLGDIPVTSDNAFRVFLLDANQKQSEGGVLIDITQLKLYTSALDSLTSLLDLTTATKIYDLDKPNNDFTLRVDGSVGTGGADMYFFVPNGLFGGDADTNIYLFYEYTNFNDGFETWALDKNSTYVNPSGGGEVPEPTTLALWTLGGSLALLRRSRRKR